MYAGALSIYPDAYFYITTQLFYTEIKMQLLDAGVKEDNISKFDIICQLPWEEDSQTFYDQRIAKLQKLYECLSDNESQNVLTNRIEFLRTRERKLMTDIRRKNQYFDEELIDFEKVDTFVDLGTFTGDTIDEFIKIKKRHYSRIYGFEPDWGLYKIAEENLKKFDNIAIIQKGTSDFDGKVSVNGNLGVMQSIEEGVFEEKMAESYFEVCRLDTFFENMPYQKIDMIKMDIEGAELATIKGARRLIETYVPILAICVYHKEDDIFSIPEYIFGLSCGKQYKMYLRHYSDNQTETVAYFIPQ